MFINDVTINVICEILNIKMNECWKFLFLFFFFFLCVINASHVYKFYVVKFIVTQKFDKMIIQNSYSHFFLEEYIVIVT